MNNTEIQSSNTSKARATRARPTEWRRPSYYVNESAEGYKLLVNLPGVSRGGVDITIEDEVLSIIGKRSKHSAEGWRALRRELPNGEFRVNFKLNVAVNETAITAKITDGVLDLTLPKADEAKPRKISVN